MITPELLSAIPLFATLEQADLEAIAVAAADVRLIADEWLVHEGEVPAFFVLLLGDLEVTKTIGGAEQVINHYHAGDFFGEVPLLLGSTVVANLRALNVVRVARFDAAAFHDLLTRSEKLAASILRTMAWRVAHLQRLATEASAAPTLLIGQPTDLACYDLRAFLAGNQVAFRWLDPHDSASAPLIPASASVGPYPIVVFADGTVLHEPTTCAVAEQLGLQTVPNHAAYDAVIIGGGPAGLSAAVYGASEGLTTLLIERAAPGGQAGTSSRIENYLGFPTGLSGDDLSARALHQAKRFGAEIVVARGVQAIRPGPASHQIVLDDDTVVAARTIVLATGVTWRTLDVEGVDALVGRGIYYGAARTEAARVRGKDVYLIGGGNSAGQAAMFFASYAQSVTLLIRAPTIEQGMSQYLIDQLATKQNVSVQLDTAVTAVHGHDELDAITVTNRRSETSTRIATNALLVFIGADAETSWLPDSIARDGHGYILTGRDVQAAGVWKDERDPYLLETSMPGIFAVGDVRYRSIKRVASGVGEGSMAIAFVHQYLALGAAVAPPATAMAAEAAPLRERANGQPRHG